MLLKFSEWMVYHVFAMEKGSVPGSVLEFFIHDSLKIFLILFVFISAIGILKSYISKEKIRTKLNRSGFQPYFWASLLGSVTPFCSCSSIPLFIGFVKAGVPLGVAFSFLITSPLVNEYLVVLMAGMFGLKITVLYTLNGMILGILAGLFLGKLDLERYIVTDIKDEDEKDTVNNRFPDFLYRLKFGIGESVAIIKKLWIWLLVSVAAGAMIHNYIPAEKIQSLISGTGIFSIPLAVIIGIPLYGSCASILPIAFVLFQKGLPLGTVLSFMMAVSALSLPEAILLRRVMRLELIAIFFSITTAGIILIGYLFNYLQMFLK